MTPTSRIVALAEAVADGQPADWDEAESSATDEVERVAIARLRVLASVGELFTAVTFSARHSGAVRDVLPPGTIWGSLRILAHVGQGRYGNVYRAWDPALERDVALKLLFETSPDDGSGSGVVHEGRLMARVHHPNVVAIHGAQRIDGLTGLWMEFIEGRTLADELAERGPFAPEEIAQVGVELCRALDAVHHAGLVHRDVKAQNVLRDRDGRIVLGDFGTGRDLDDDDETAGTLAGTPAYVAPEIFAGSTATPQSDLYSLGALLFRLATGTFPVTGRSLRDLRDAHARGVRTTVTTLRPDLPPGLAATIDTALEPDRKRRFRSATDLRQALEASVSQPRPAGTTRGRLVYAAVSLVLLTAVATGSWMLRGGPDRWFAEGNWALLGEVENRTGEAVFDGTLRVALERELSRSTVINVVPILEASLDRQQEAIEALADQPASGIAPRVLLAGNIAPRSGGYLVNVRVTDRGRSWRAGHVCRTCTQSRRRTGRRRPHRVQDSSRCW
jgi:eukaryotic-like serine/threonine-protein kinase